MIFYYIFRFFFRIIVSSSSKTSQINYEWTQRIPGFRSIVYRDNAIVCIHHPLIHHHPLLFRCAFSASEWFALPEWILLCAVSVSTSHNEHSFEFTDGWMDICSLHITHTHTLNHSHTRKHSPLVHTRSNGWLSIVGGAGRWYKRSYNTSNEDQFSGSSSFNRLELIKFCSIYSVSSWWSNRLICNIIHSHNRRIAEILANNSGVVSHANHFWWLKIQFILWLFSIFNLVFLLVFFWWWCDDCDSRFTEIVKFCAWRTVN